MATRKDKAAPGAMVEVRILHDCIYGLWGQVVELPRELVAQAKASGCVDDDPAAVAYARAQLAPSSPEH